METRPHYNRQANSLKWISKNLTRVCLYIPGTDCYLNPARPSWPVAVQKKLASCGEQHLHDDTGREHTSSNFMARRYWCSRNQHAEVRGEHTEQHLENGGSRIKFNSNLITKIHLNPTHPIPGIFSTLSLTVVQDVCQTVLYPASIPRQAKALHKMCLVQRH